MEETVDEKLLCDGNNHPQRQLKGLGLLLGTLSGCCYATSSLFVKLLASNTEISVMTIAWIRQLCAASFFGLSACVMKTKCTGKGLMEHTCCVSLGLLVSLLVILQYRVFQQINLADANAIISCSPIFVMLASCIYRRKLCTAVDASTMIVSLVGVILCVKPPFLFQTGQKFLHPTGYLEAVCVSIIWSLIYTISKVIGHLGVVSLNLWASSIPVSVYSLYIIASGYLKFSTDPQPNLYIFCNGVMSVFSMLFLGVAILLDNPLMASIGRTSEVALGFVFDVCIFGVEVEWLRIFGAVILIIGISVSALLKLLGQAE